jgi:hypothetical protein
METQEEYMEQVSRFIRAGLLMAGAYDKGELIFVERDWVPFFPIFPRKTINDEWAWLRKIYSRRVWRSTGFAQEPYTEYGDIFDVLK